MSIKVPRNESLCTCWLLKNCVIIEYFRAFSGGRGGSLAAGRVMRAVNPTTIFIPGAGVAAIRIDILIDAVFY